VVVSSIDEGFDYYEKFLLSEGFARSPNAQVEFARLLSPTVKAFDILLPASPSPPAPAAIHHRNSIGGDSKSNTAEFREGLLDILHMLQPVREFCSHIYYPLDYKGEKRLYPEYSSSPVDNLFSQAQLTLPSFDSR
jgi:hypothetical protein